MVQGAQAVRMEDIEDAASLGVSTMVRMTPDYREVDILVSTEEAKSLVSWASLLASVIGGIFIPTTSKPSTIKKPRLKSRGYLSIRYSKIGA